MSVFSRRKPSPAIDAPPIASVSASGSVPTLGRRFLAWSLELAIFAGSIAGPLYWGGQLNQRAEEPSTNLTPVLRVTQTTLAKSLGLSPRSLPQKVTPLTNVLWSIALGLPLALAVAHFYSIGRYGRSWPKQWLGVQVLALNGKLPGWRRSLLREGGGKWGGPALVAYGIWQLSGGFPGLLILGGLSVLALVGENLTGLGNRPHRSWHDWLAGTCVVDQETGAIIRLSNLWDEEAAPSSIAQNASQALILGDTYGGLTSVVLDPASVERRRHRIHPSGLGLAVGMLLILGGLAGVGSYHLFTVPKSVNEAEETLYTRLVSTLTNPEVDTAARQAAVLALGNLSDDRVAPLLVDLVAQTDDSQWLDVLQQALMAQGTDAVPALRRLNQSLANDLPRQNDVGQRHSMTLRLQTVNQILAKLVLLGPSDRDANLDFSRLHLGRLSSNNAEFILILQNQDLSGVQWRGTVLNGAQLQGSTFFSPGDDGHPDTYDDNTADLSGADLTQASLVGANLSFSRLAGTSLLNATLNRTNFTLADLTRVNLENAQLIQANLSQASLPEARLSKADLTAAQLPGANLEAARLSEITATGAQLSGAVMLGISAKSANLADADLSAAVLEDADLTGASLQGANLSDANLRNAILRDADLREVWLQGADLAGADLAGAIFTVPSGKSDQGFVTATPDFLSRHKLTGVDFSDVQNLDPEQLTFVCSRGAIHPTCDSPVLN
ncbi:MAG: pentapeptide repeat-containing protein [Cyanobacteria bacterium J06626_18]